MLAVEVTHEMFEAEMRTLDLVNTATMAEQLDRGTCDAIAVNSDHLALIRRDDQLVIVQSDDHAAISDVDTFPLDQLASAGHRLEALSMESEGVTDLQRRQGAAAAELGRFFNGAGDPGMVLDQRLEMVDHRPLGWGPSSTLTDRAKTLADIGSFSQVTAKTIAHRPGRICILQRQYFVTNDGFENAIDCLLVFDIDGVDEPQVIGIHQYGSDQLDDALAHFDSPITGAGTEDQRQ